MKQFLIILKFEVSSYLKNKSFIGLTLLLVALMGIYLFSPRFMPAITSLFDTEPEEVSEILVNSDFPLEDSYIDSLNLALSDYNASATPSDLTIEEMKEAVKNQEVARGLYLTSMNSYTDIVDDISLTDEISSVIQGVVTSNYQSDLLISSGLKPEAISTVLFPEVKIDLVQTGVNQVENFLYTYILIFLLYMGILIYGQFVVSSVVTEKTSRAMEVLVTSAKPTSFIFAKVIGSGLAGISQMVLILSSAFVFYNMNTSYWSDDPLVSSLFNIPLYLIGYILLFFLLGYFLYAFMFGAAGSLASKIEDMNALITPITILFVISFIVTSTSLASGDVDSTLMVICSMVPFTAPMSMFTRIAMSDVPTIEIIISVAILILTTGFIGWLAAKIYRYGVFFYGNKPSIFKAIKLIITDARRK